MSSRVCPQYSKPSVQSLAATAVARARTAATANVFMAAIEYFEGRRGGEDVIFLARRVIGWKKLLRPLCGNAVDFIRLWMRKS